MTHEPSTALEMSSSGTELDVIERQIVVQKQGTSGSDLTDIGWSPVTFFQNYAAYAGISLQEAIQQSAFLLCADVIAQDLAKAPMHLCRRGERDAGDIIAPREHPVAMMLAMSPNPRLTWVEFREMMGLWSAYSSNAYAWVVRNQMGEPRYIVPLMSSRVNKGIDQFGVFYDVTAGSDYEAQLLGGVYFRQIRERDMIHVRARLLDGMDGLSTLVVGASTLKTGTNIEKYRNDLYGNAGWMRGIFSKPLADGKALPEPAYLRLKTQLTAMLTNFMARRDPIVLEGGMEFQPLTANAEETAITTQFATQVLATGRLLRIPPHKLFQMEGVKYENLDTMEKSYIGDTLEPIFRRFEERFSRLLLTNEEMLDYQIWIDREAIQLKDAKTENERIKIDVGLGIMTRGEARRRRRLPKLDDALEDVFVVPVNMQIVDFDNEVVVQASASQAGPGDNTTGSQPADQSK